MSYRQKLTDLGRDVIAKGQTGQTITFTRIQLGEGAISDPNSIDGMIALVAPVMSSPIVGVARTALGQVTVTTKIPLASIPRDFHLTEIGLWATVGSDPEVLYGVSYSIGIPSVISQEMGGGATAEHTISIAVLVGTTEDVTAVFVPDIEMINIGTGASLYSGRVGNEFRIKRIQTIGELGISETADTVTLTIGATIPVGGLIPFAGPNPPAGWLVADGSLQQIATHPNLFNVIGTRYGGDGVTNFALPDCRDRSLIGVSSTRALGSTGGAATHTLALQELASHNHSTTDNGHNHGGAVHDWGHSHGVIDNIHGHGSPAHSHSVTMGGGSNPEGMGWGVGLTGAPGGGTGARGLLWMPRTYGLGNSPESTRVEYNPWLAWAHNAGASAAATAATISNAWSNISSTYGQFTGVQIPWGTSNLSINNNGSSQPHNNMPPYLTVQWLIRA